MIRQLTGLVVLVFSAVCAMAQQAKPLVFREEIFDFGQIKEVGGPVMHEFQVTNNSARPIKILSVQASCGCTTPGWSKEVIAPGKTGFVQASFNPKGRPGYFNKTLTVTSDFDTAPIILQIKGQVEMEGKAAEVDYQIMNGSWRLRAVSFNMGKVFMKDQFETRDFQFMNSGEKPVALADKIVAPSHIKVDVSPATVAPGEKGTITIGYNPKVKNQYGFQSDNIEIHTDDTNSPIKTFHVYATIEDYFAPLTPEELAKAPRLTLNTSLDFGRIKQNAETTRELSFTNTGRKELSIKSLQGNCRCLTVSASKQTLKPGESATMKIAFNPETRSGTQTKAVTIYSNDPQGPIQRVTLSAYVED